MLLMEMCFVWLRARYQRPHMIWRGCWITRHDTFKGQCQSHKLCPSEVHGLNKITWGQYNDYCLLQCHDSVALVRDWTIPSDSHLSAKLVPTFSDRGCHVVSVTDPHGNIHGFLDRSHYFFFQVAPQLYLIEPLTCGSAARNSGGQRLVGLFTVTHVVSILPWWQREWFLPATVRHCRWLHDWQSTRLLLTFGNIPNFTIHNFN
jgi:hypothetical protein